MKLQEFERETDAVKDGNKKTINKLRLNKETIRLLTDPELKVVMGGDGSSGKICTLTHDEHGC